MLPVTDFKRPEKGETNHSDQGAALGVLEVGIFEVEAARLEGFEKRLYLPPVGVSAQGFSRIAVGHNDDELLVTAPSCSNGKLTPTNLVAVVEASRLQGFKLPKKGCELKPVVS